MEGMQRLWAAVIAISLGNFSGNGKLETLGVVVEAQNAKVGTSETAAGTTVYNGDRLATGDGGVLKLRAEDAMLELAEQSSAVVRNASDGGTGEFEAELVSGAVVLSVGAKASGEIVCSGARMRPAGEARGIVQVRRVNANELIVYAQRGRVQIVYRAESATIEEGKSYRVRLNSEDGEAEGGGTKEAGKARKALLLTILGAGAAAGIALGVENRGRHKGMESPDRP